MAHHFGVSFWQVDGAIEARFEPRPPTSTSLPWSREARSLALPRRRRRGIPRRLAGPSLSPHCQ